MTKIVFFGSSAYSTIVLDKLLSLADFEVVAIISKLDKPFGRDQVITANPVAKFATDHHIKLIQIEEFSPEVKSQLRALNADIALCVAFGPPFFDEELIDLFPFHIVNIHPSPLPKYRGATPGPWQIIYGETKSAVTFFQIDPLPDHGPIIQSLPFEISPADTADTFYQKAFSVASENLNSVLSAYIQNPAKLIEQDHSQKSYFPKLTKELAQIDWSWEPTKIERFIRALLPWPVAWTIVTDLKGDQIKMKIFSAHLENNTLVPQQVQLENKTKTNWSEINRYYQIVKK